MKKIVSTLIISIIFCIFACPLKTVKGMMDEGFALEKSELENLPSEILEHIISYLPRRDCIALAYAAHNFSPIIDNYYEPARKISITNETLNSPQNFKNLLLYLESHCIREIDFSCFWTEITDEALNQILQHVGHSLGILHLKRCHNRQNLNFSYCQNLQELDLSYTKITDEALNRILQQIGHSLRKLDLKNSYMNLQNFDFSYCQNLQELDFSYTDITDEALNQILQQVGHSLRILNLYCCHNLQNPNFSHCHNLQNLDLDNCTNLQNINLNYCHNLQTLCFCSVNITDYILNQILQQVGNSLKKLYLANPWLMKADFSQLNLQNPNFSYCLQLQELCLAHADITDEVLNQILQQVGRSLRILKLPGCSNLQNREAIINWARENDVEIYW